MGSLGNPRLASQRDPPDYTLQKVKSDWTDLIEACPVVNQSFEMGYGNVTAASSGGGESELHTTTTKSYDPLKLTCLVCTGEREGHHILDNYDGQGITIMIGDQHSPSVITIATTSCVVVMRYSNTTLTDLYEYLMLPNLRSFGEFHSKERGGFTDILQAALHDRLEIKLVVQ